ncbi:MAG: hypothetical protein E6X87_05920, partial [Lachnospiraceae bacterium]|nr:hypothetical protein [Lachnospiraceae bacterium]
MQVDIFHRMFEFYTTSYTHFENRAEDILIYLEEMGDCVKKEIIQEDTLYTQECDMYHFESKFARQCQERIRAERGYHFQITEEQEEEYFSHIVDADVLFCVMYAHWIVSAKYCYAAHESRLHQNDRCKRFALCLVLTVR